MADQRLPVVNGDDGQWGDILNQYLAKEHYNIGGLTSDPANGGHKTITIRAGTQNPNTAPLKFTSGPLLTNAEPGAVEFLTDKLYVTSTGSVRETVASYDDAAGATGDLYYRTSTGDFARLPIGTALQVLKVVSGLPTWANNSGGGTSRTVSSVSTATTAGSATSTDYVYNVSGTTTITLPTAVGNTNLYTITNVGTNTVTVATTSAQTINGSASATLPIANMSLSFISDNANWVVQ